MVLALAIELKGVDLGAAEILVENPACIVVDILLCYSYVTVFNH